MRVSKFQCGGCLKCFNDLPRVTYCTPCHTEYRRLGRLVELIQQVHPNLRGAFRSDLFIRLWIGWLKTTRKPKQHIEAAETLLQEKPAKQGELW